MALPNDPTQTATPPVSAPAAPATPPAAPTAPPPAMPGAPTGPTINDLQAAFRAMIPEFMNAFMTMAAEMGGQAQVDPAAGMPPEAIPGAEPPMPDAPPADAEPGGDEQEPDPDRDRNCMGAGMPARKDRNMSAAPSATNGFIPGSTQGQNQKPDQYHREGEPDRYAMLEREVKSLRGEVDRLSKENEHLANVNMFTDRYARLNKLAGEYNLDVDKEVEDTIDYNEEQFKAHVEDRIPTYYQRVEPKPEDRVRVDYNSRDGAPDRGYRKPLTQAQYAMVAKHAPEHGHDFEETVAVLKEKRPDDWARAGS